MSLAAETGRTNGQEQYAKVVERTDAKVQALVDRVKADHPDVATQAAESNIPPEYGNLALALGKNWAEKPMDAVRSRAVRLNILGDHPALNGLFEEKGKLDPNFSNESALRRDVTERVAMLASHELMMKQNGSGPAAERRPEIRQTAGVLAVAVVNEVLDKQDRREKAIGHIAPRVDSMGRVKGELSLTELARQKFRDNNQAR